jgi:RNA polymerase sigma factor (sigma-70 family)
MMAPEGRFGSTIWSDIELAREGDKRAMNRLVGSYREPVVQFLRRSGLSQPDAEDLAQDVFIEFVEKEVLKKADPQLGRFRSLLIAVTKLVLSNHLRRQAALKRGGGAEIGRIAADSQIKDAARPPKDQVFDQLWVMHLLRAALKQLEKDSERMGNQQAEIVRLSIFERATYTEISDQLRLEPGIVRNLLTRGKQRLLHLVRKEIANYAIPGSEYEGELEFVMSLIGGSVRG